MKGEVEKGKKDGSKSCPCVMFAKRYEQILKMLRFLLEVIGMDRIRNEWFRGNAGLEMRLARYG